MMEMATRSRGRRITNGVIHFVSSEFLKLQEEIKDMQANGMLREDLLEHLWALHIANLHDY